MPVGYIVQCQNNLGMNGAMCAAKDHLVKGRPWRLFFGSTASLFRTRRRARVLVKRTGELSPNLKGKLSIVRVERAS